MADGFFQVPNSLIQTHGKQIGAMGIAVYSAILLHDYGNDRCWPSQATIAGYLDCDRKTVNRTIRKLVDAGLLELDPRFNDKGQTSNRYRPKLVVQGKPVADRVVSPLPRKRSAATAEPPQPPTGATIGYNTVKPPADEEYPF